MFDPEFLESLSGLRIVARRVPRHGRHAEQRSLDMGGGSEFRDAVERDWLPRLEEFAPQSRCQSTPGPMSASQVMARARQRV